MILRVRIAHSDVIVIMFKCYEVTHITLGYTQVLYAGIPLQTWLCVISLDSMVFLFTLKCWAFNNGADQSTMQWIQNHNITPLSSIHNSFRIAWAGLYQC